jgi:hypothetical protein
LAARQDRKASPDRKARQVKTRSATATHSVTEMRNANATQNATARPTPEDAQQVSIKPLTMMEGPSASVIKDVAGT